MIKKILIAIFFAGFVIPFESYPSFAQGNERDPFESALPTKEEKDSTKESAKKTNMPPPVVIEGVLWDSSMPQAIIDGDVYKVGDTLKNLDAKIYKIEKNTVFIFYEGKLHEMKGTGKKEGK